MARKLSRRSFLECALAGGTAAGTANLTIMRDAFAQASGPLVIGHHCDLTGAIASWGVWHEKAAKAAVQLINQGGGIAGRKVELVQVASGWRFQGSTSVQAFLNRLFRQQTGAQHDAGVRSVGAGGDGCNKDITVAECFVGGR